MKAGWEEVPLDGICSIARGGSPRPIKEYITDDPDGINWIKIGDTEQGGRFITQTAQKIKKEGIARSRFVKSGDFLLSNSMSFGRPYILKISGCIHDGWLVLEPDYARVDQGYLYYVLGSKVVFDQFDKAAAGSTVRNLNKDLAAKVVLPLPPLDEQKRIVAVLDAAFDGLTRARANVEANLQNARELFEATARDVFLTGEEKWQQETLPDVCSDFGRGKSKHRPRNEPSLYGGKYPFLQTGDLSKDGRHVSEFKQTYSEKGLAQSKLWPEETVCIAIVGATIGESAITAMPACFPDSVIGMVADKSKALPEYVQHLLSFYKKDLKKAGEGSARDNINLATFKNWKFPMPSIEEQSAVVLKLGKISESKIMLTDRYQSKLADLDELRQSLLQKAFAGELT